MQVIGKKVLAGPGNDKHLEVSGIAVLFALQYSVQRIEISYYSKKLDY